MNLIIWIQSITPNGGGVELLNPAVNTLIQLYGKIIVLGVIAPPNVSFSGIRNVAKENLRDLNYDLILVTGHRASLVPILDEAETLGIDTDKVVLDRTVCIPFFTLRKYNKLRHSKLSIFSRDCFGGIVYNRFGLPFRTPTINMFTSERGFLNFLDNPIENIRKQLIFQRTEKEPTLKINYPVYKIGETEWFMNHYPNFEEAFQKWYDRSYKINWYNLLVVMSTTNPEFLAEFDKLPYAKKICFVPFETELESGFYIDSSKYTEKYFGRLAHLVANGEIIEYDLWDMLLYGKKTPLKLQK